MKKYIIIIIALLQPIMSWALTAQEVLQRAASKIQTTGALTAKFTGSTAGTLVISGKKFSIDAGGFGIWYNGSDMWTYSHQTGETTITTPTPAELLETNPMEIIKSYSSKFTATKVSEQQGKYTLKLTPKAKGENVKTATLVINTHTWLPSSIDMVMNNGSRFTLNIISITEDKAVAPARFEYPRNNYPGIEVVDLR